MQWVAMGLVGLYGLVNVAAGLAQVRQGQIQRWAALGMVLGGGLLLAAAGMLAQGAVAVWLLVAGLVGIHLLAVNNGLRLHGRLTPSHHLVRAAVSVALVALALWGMP